LLDTGCDRSVCPRRLCRNAKLLPVTTELYLASGARLEVFGATRLHFEINGRKMFADVSVLDGVDELFLGYDWLVRNNYVWLFGAHRVTINGVSVQLRTRSVRPSVRRIYARESILVPANMSVNVPVRLAFVNLHEQRADWLTESKEVKPGLLTARTLLNDDDTHTTICFINVSG